MEEEKKPPIGLTPKWIHQRMRIKEILDAMERYSDANIAIPLDWILELKELLAENLFNITI